MTQEWNDRKTWMSLLAKAPVEALALAWDEADLGPDYRWLRRPETGAVMVRGRMGGTGLPFNLGEMTVTRCALELADGGAVGHGYVQGRSADAARAVALIDALSEDGQVEMLEATILTPLRAEAEATKTKRAARAAATKVEFFTMVRGE